MCFIKCLVFLVIVVWVIGMVSNIVIIVVINDVWVEFYV